MKSAMRRRISPSVPFTLTFEDEKGKASFSYRLAYNWNSLALAEEKLGQSMIVDIGTAFDNPSVTNVSVLLWAALQEYHSEDFAGDEGLELVRQNMTISIATAARSACSDAYVKQLPLEQQEKLKKAVAEMAALAAAGVKQVPDKDPLAQSEQAA